jgi:tRNA(His) guanylyltransferase
MKESNTLASRMKRYELEEAGRRMMPLLPIVARLDGRAFHTFTQGLSRPYSPEFTRCMVETAAVLVDEFGADLAYTQSDEISLFWKNDDPFKQMAFDGRFQKWVSLLAAEASVAFNLSVRDHLPQKAPTRKKRAKLDCRVWQLPNMFEVYNVFLWREDDATRNSLQMAAQSHYSQKELHKAASPKLHDLLHAKGINWNDFPAFFKRGTYVARRKYERELTPAELDNIPEDRRPTGPILRSGIFVLDAQPIQSYKSIVPFLDGTVKADYQVEGV